MEKTKIITGHSTACGYAIFGFMWFSMLLITIYIWIRSFGPIRAQDILSLPREAWEVLIYFIFMSGINFGMAIAVWSVISKRQKTQRIILGVAMFFAIASAVLLIATIASWYVKKFPNWYSPFYNVYPATFFAFGYGYLAYDLRKILKISNKAIEPDRE